jgi:hypothetical protein
MKKVLGLAAFIFAVSFISTAVLYSSEIPSNENSTLAMFKAPTLLRLESFPANRSVNVAENPTLSLIVNVTPMVAFHVIFRTNASGAWTTIGQNDSIVGGTFSQTTEHMDVYGRHYWWSANITATHRNWTNISYSFWSRKISTIVDPITPYECASPTVTITAHAPDDLDNITLFYSHAANNLSAIEPAGVFRRTSQLRCFRYPDEVVIRNNTAFVACRNGNAVVAVDLTNKSAMHVISVLMDNPNLKKVNSIVLTPDGKYAYTLTTDNVYLCMINVTNASSMHIVNVTKTAEPGMYLWYDHDYLFAATQRYCYIYNISNKQAYQLQLITKFNTSIPPHSKLWHPLTYHNILYLSIRDETTKNQGKGVYIYDVSNKSNPVLMNILSPNSSVTVAKVISWKGFEYLIFAGIQKPAEYWRGYLSVYNISAGNATHPKRMYDLSTLDDGGNLTEGAFCFRNGYLIVGTGNNNISDWRSGFSVWDLTNISQPRLVYTLTGKGEPNYLDGCHDIVMDQNGDTTYFYVLTQNDDSLNAYKINWQVHKTWAKAQTIDTAAPWSWTFTFPQGPGFYEFYTLGQKAGFLTETVPADSDARCCFFS